MIKDILPDCRTREPGNIIQSPMGNWVPIFCANCGKEGGSVPEENMTFVFWLCTPCAETYGVIAGMMMMPDEVFWDRVTQEQVASHGRMLTEQELVDVVVADASPLATLLKERR
jgi:hypothetical protein